MMEMILHWHGDRRRGRRDTIYIQGILFLQIYIYIKQQQQQQDESSLIVYVFTRLTQDTSQGEEKQKEVN